jgi:hypothetical protein
MSMFCDLQLIVIIEEGGLGRILSCLLAFLLLFSAESNGFLKVPILRIYVANRFVCNPQTLLEYLAKVIVDGIISRVLVPGARARSRPPSFVLVTKAGIIDGGSGGHPIPHMSSRPSFFPQPGVVGEEIGDIFGLLTDVRPLVLTILVDELEFLESLDKIDVVAEIYDNVFRASVQTIIKEGQRLNQIVHVSERPK